MDMLEKGIQGVAVWHSHSSLVHCIFGTRTLSQDHLNEETRGHRPCKTSVTLLKVHFRLRYRQPWLWKVHIAPRIQLSYDRTTPTGYRGFSAKFYREMCKAARA